MLATSRRFIRLSEHRDHFMPIVDQSFKRRNCKLRRAHEDQLHGVLITECVDKVTTRVPVCELCGPLRLCAENVWIAVRIYSWSRHSFSRKGRKGPQSSQKANVACTVTGTYNPNLICN